MNKPSVYITGAGHPEGIGMATARRFAGEGYNILLLDIAAQSDSLQRNVNALQRDGQSIDFALCNVTEQSQIRDVVTQYAERWGSPTALVNCAGVAVGAEQFLDGSDTEWSLSWNVNVLGVRNMCRAVLPLMQQAATGSIVNVASLAGLGAIAGIPANYTATKFAVVGLTKQLALEFAPNGVRINAVCPGSVETQMRQVALNLLARSEGITVAEAEALENSTIALGRAADTREVADAIYFLASDQASYITGTALEIGGGMGKGV